MAKYTAMQIVHWFLKRNEQAIDEKGADRMTLRQLLKLLYYAEGCYLAIHNGEKLFGERIVAWEHGPVVEEVYRAYDDAYNLPLTEEDIRDADNIDTEDQELLEQVFNVFGEYSTWALRDKTHEETPWLEATQNGQVLNREINQETMKRYFEQNYIGE